MEMISIIVPVYNAKQWVARCIKSVLEQTYTNLEVVVIDDGSNDGSGEICDSFAKKDRRVKVFHQENEGISAARNKGLEMVTGEFIQFADDDDYLEPSICQDMMYIYEKKNVDWVICGINVIQKGEVIRRSKKESKYLYLSKDINDYQYIQPIFNALWNKLYLKKYIDFKFENTTDGEDFLFNLAYLQNINTAYVINKILYNVVLDNAESWNKKIRRNKLTAILSMRIQESQICKRIYGSNINLLFNYTSVIKAIHYCYLEQVRHSGKRKATDFIAEYNHNKFVQESAKAIIMSGKKDKNMLFAQFIVNNYIAIIYWMLYVESKLR